MQPARITEGLCAHRLQGKPGEEEEKLKDSIIFEGCDFFVIVTWCRFFGTSLIFRDDSAHIVSLMH